MTICDIIIVKKIIVKMIFFKPRKPFFSVKGLKKQRYNDDVIFFI